MDFFGDLFASRSWERFEGDGSLIELSEEVRFLLVLNILMLPTSCQ